MHHHTHLPLHTFIHVQCLYAIVFVLCHPGIYESGHHASQKEGQQPAWPRARCPPEYFVLWRDRPYVHGNRCYWQEGEEPGKEKGLVITVCLSVCLSALGQECSFKKCGQMIVSNLIVRVSGYYQMLFVKIFGKGKYSLQLVTMCTLKILANACMQCWLYVHPCMQCWLYVHPCVMGANWTTKTAWLVYGEWQV